MNIQNRIRSALANSPALPLDVSQLQAMEDLIDKVCAEKDEKISRLKDEIAVISQRLANIQIG